MLSRSREQEDKGRDLLAKYSDCERRVWGGGICQRTNAMQQFHDLDPYEICRRVGKIMEGRVRIPEQTDNMNSEDHSE